MILEIRDHNGQNFDDIVNSLKEGEMFYDETFDHDMSQICEHA